MLQLRQLPILLPLQQPLPLLLLLLHCQQQQQVVDSLPMNPAAAAAGCEDTAVTVCWGLSSCPTLLPLAGWYNCTVLWRLPPAPAHPGKQGTVTQASLAPQVGKLLVMALLLRAVCFGFAAGLLLYVQTELH